MLDPPRLKSSQLPQEILIKGGCFFFLKPPEVDQNQAKLAGSVGFQFKLLRF